MVQNHENRIFPEVDCSSLNTHITRDEVRHSINNAKIRKATSYENIPADILRNEHCIDILYKIINFAFEAGEIPSQWLKGTINLISKGYNPRCPLNYRPKRLLSIPCKIYANILNKKTQHMSRRTIFLICFPMDYRDFSVKSKVIIHCFKQWDYDFRFSLFVNSFYRR